MTHKDIYTKFMIEYDKANVTSSYPSLTEYEVATVLDKAYNALIAQKVTGNNVRRAGFESDTKAIADIEPLVVRSNNNNITPSNKIRNGYELNMSSLDPKMLYFVQAYLKQMPNNAPGHFPMDDFDDTSLDARELPVQLVSHDMATKFFATAYNLPWVKIPVCFIESNILYFVCDPINKPLTTGASIVYIKKPNTFVKDLTNPSEGWESYFDWSTNSVPPEYEFECNDTVAEELISLAIAFALENVESQRLNSKLNMRGLEA